VRLSAPREPARLFLLGRRIVGLLHLAHEHLERLAWCMSACHVLGAARVRFEKEQMNVLGSLRTNIGIVLG
jgi:hypothetical protein